MKKNSIRIFLPVLFVFFVASGPFIVSAQQVVVSEPVSIESIKEKLLIQINELVALVTELQKKLEIAKQEELKNFRFTRDLSFGSESRDVYMLQRVLNRDPDTAIAGGGAGSPGKETYYFGTETKDAVKRLQNKYPVDILIPQYKVAGDGIVDERTRFVLNYLITDGQSAFDTVTTPVITSINPSSIKNGETIRIYGDNFAEYNTVQTTIGIFENIPISFDGALEVSIDSEFITQLNTLPDGVTEEDRSIYATLKQPDIYIAVVVKNENGTSEPITLTITP